MRKEILSIKKYNNYEIRKEKIFLDFENYPDQYFIYNNAYTPNGDLIGDPKLAKFICDKMGIKPEKADSSHKVCSIGFSEKEKKWYGWSHRAIHGFKIGDVVDSKDHLCATSGWTDDYLKEHPEEDLSLPVGFVARTIDDCKRMAIAFADAVG